MVVHQNIGYSLTLLEVGGPLSSIGSEIQVWRGPGGGLCSR